MPPCLPADIFSMSGISGSPIERAVVQAAQAQQAAARLRDRQRAAQDDPKRFEDLVELSIAGVESAEAVRHIPQNDSEQADDEHAAQRRLASQKKPKRDDDAAPKLDVKA